eukprot:gnl/Ergobibamus_cyprinoides/269.p1 GENE.gnl/Ergobibamus_cyprinoides/269~~gnl/Ergobibamus_cyprinoides/269.p1  ORF type:complete len:362 (+),score=114.59 gnl/Ergobibamus_cyprinoides/269:251-1336(+)
MIEMFVHNPHMVEINEEYYEKYAGMTFSRRETDVLPRIDEVKAQIRSGDSMLYRSMSGIETMENVQLAAYAGHSGFFLRNPETDELMVVDTEPFLVMPSAKIGVVMETFDDWYANLRHNCDPDYCTTAWLPLSDKSYAKMDTQKMWDYFTSHLQNLPYSWANVVFSGINGAGPDAINPPLDRDSLLAVLLLLQDAHIAFEDETITWALNIRLGVSGYELDDVIELADSRGLSVWDVMAMPEQDEWMGIDGGDCLYPSGPEIMCSSSYCYTLRAAGLIDADVNCSEFTPQDMYQLDIYADPQTYRRPAECDVPGDDGFLCQLSGQILMGLSRDQVSFVPLYDHMNEKCIRPSPDFVRQPEWC